MKKKKNIKSMLLFVAFVALVTGCSQNRQSKNIDRRENPTEIADSQEQNVDNNAAGGKVNYLTTVEFKKKVMDYDRHPQEWVFEGDRPAIIDFYATWCRPCKMTAPIVEELAREYNGKIDFYKVDIDKEHELAAAFGIQSIPTFLFIPVKGNPTIQMGAMQKEEFEGIIKSVLVKK